ncbi:hypothetical protein MLD38_034264 [Melastoma candidum]|uniref:Uncharacterized protein n=1 Tax=Melastoma candidum TaxID=119954 RepID=A0ACB9M908_9MYRT|nr:hypothetical protein MLD38_034264 [Melastoma candidum]
MRWKEFADLCQIKVPSLRIRSRNDGRETVEARRRAVASCLHQMCEIIYFPEAEFLILDFEWFCTDLLGQLTRLDGRKFALSTSNGFVTRKDMEKILRGSLQSQIPGMGSKVLDYLDANDIIKLMLRLELCHEQDRPVQIPLLLPSLLEDSRAKRRAG